MRKGFILTLTALATTFLVTSAVALGPVVSGVPDVYIGPAAAAGAPVEIGTNTFRYSGALTLWDYVIPGVSTGDGSGSDTLYQAWAVKDATLSGGTGSYLPATPASGVHYSIIQDGNEVEALFIQPTIEVGDAGWAAEINADLNFQGSALADYALGEAGSLTFRNVRLSPLPEPPGGYPAPTAVGGLPAGILDAQEATLYVSDTNTTPGADKVLLVTVDTGADTLSGGLKWTMVTDYSADTSGFNAFKFKSDGTTFDFTASDLTMTNTGTSLRIQTPVTNSPSTYFYYGEYGVTQAGLVTSNLYRATASITAPGGTSNASIMLALNGRGSTGYGLLQTNSGQAGGPTASASDWSVFLVPVEDGPVQAQFIVFDSTSATGGLVEASSYQVQSVPLVDLLASASVVQATQTSFTVSSTGFATSTEWGYFDTPFSANGLPTFSHTPANGATGPIIMSGATATLNTGMASMQGPTNAIPTTVDSLVLVRAKLSTSSSASAVLPTIWMNVENGPIQGGSMIQRDIAGTSGPTSTPADYYVVFQAKDTAAQFNLRILADAASINGNVQMTELEVLEADMPIDP
jgi:hypothetical protein